MNAPARIAADIDEATLAKIEAAALQLGVSVEQFAGDALRRAADEAIGLTDRLEQGRAQIAADDYSDHDAFLATLRQWKADRVRPH